ncbi:MAG: ABC transporter ATP-binding protein [Candidatus Saccharimonadales bacterium]
MLDKNVAIDVKSVSKDFFLPYEKRDTLKQKVTQVFKVKGAGVNVQHALQNISFQVYKGEFFGIVGRNGSGKSTLLKILAKTYTPTSGSADINGRLIPFIELGVGFNPELTGRDNVYLNGALLGFSRKEIDEKYEDIVEFAELGKFMNQRLKNYSSGMKVRLAFSVAIQANADILLLDEVLAVGDAAFQKKCFDYFRQLKSKKITVVFVTHNMDQVREYCDRAMLIEDSVVVDIGDPNEIAQLYHRLFIKNGLSSIRNNDYVDRWGEGGVSMSNVKIDKSTYSRADEKITVSFDFKYEKIISQPIRLGIALRNQSGQMLAGVNSELLGVKLPHFDINKIVNYTWSIDNIFKEGDYKVSLAAEGQDGTVFEWLNNAVTFSVESEIKTPYIVQPKISFKKLNKKE